MAHEFFDALPLHQFERTVDGWRERLVVHGEPTDEHPYNFQFVLAPEDTATSQVLPGILAACHPDDPLEEVGTNVEVNFEAMRICGQLAERIQADGGAALVVDYGDEGVISDTFRVRLPP